MVPLAKTLMRKAPEGLKTKKIIVFISIQVKGLVFTTAKKIAQRRIVK